MQMKQTTTMTRRKTMNKINEYRENKATMPMTDKFDLIVDMIEDLHNQIKAAADAYDVAAERFNNQLQRNATTLEDMIMELQKNTLWHININQDITDNQNKMIDLLLKRAAELERCAVVKPFSRPLFREIEVVEANDAAHWGAIEPDESLAPQVVPEVGHNK